MTDNLECNEYNFCHSCNRTLADYEVKNLDMDKIIPLCKYCINDFLLGYVTK